MRVFVAMAVAVTVAGCATVSNPVPEGYAGSTVELEDTGERETDGKGVFFAAVAIDGREIENSLRESRRASAGRGFSLTGILTTRQVPVTPMKLKLIGTHMTAAPIHELAARAAGTFFSVEGVVDFRPVEGRKFLVTGELTKAKSCVWVADAATKAPVTERVCTQ
jgi:hypothetical protein